MSITLISGPANSGKVATLVDAFATACAAGERPWLVVPTRGDVRRAQAELVRRGTVLGARVGTFPELSRALAGAQVRELPAGADALLVAELLRRPSLHVRAAAYPGFARTAAATIAELRGARMASEAAWQAAVERLPWAERATWTSLVEHFASRLDELGLVDAAGIERMAVDAVRAGEVVAPLFAYGFDDLSDQQVELVEALGARSKVLLALPWERGRYAFARRDALVDRLRTGGADIVDHGAARFDSELLAVLERSLFEPTASPAPAALTACGDVRFVECCGELQQAESIARAIARLVEAGTPPDRIACLASDPASSRPLLEPVLRRAGIPVTFETARPVASTPAGRAVLDLLDAALDDDPERFESFARSRCSGIAAARVDAWARRRRRDAVPGAAAAGPAASGHWLADAPSPPSLRALVAAGGGSLSIRDAVPFVRSMLDELEPRSTGDRRLVRAIDEAVASLLDVDVAGSLSDVRALVGSMRIPPPATRAPDSVVVAPITSVRTDRFDAVVLFGLHSGGFGGGTDDDAPHVARELAYVAVTRARRKLVCIRQMAGGDGREKAPHPVWLELRRLAPDAPESIRPLDAIVPAPESVLLEWERPLVAARLAGESALPAREHWPAWLSHALPPEQRPVWGTLTDHVVVPDLADKGLRVTEVEAYVSCPARWLVERHLLDDRDEPAGRPQVVGRLMHKLLELVLPQLHDGLDPTARLQLVHDTIDAAVAGLDQEHRERSGSAPPAAAAATPAERELVLLLVERFIVEEQAAGEVRVEQGFGPDLDHPPLVVDGVPIRGRIDRIDVAADGTAVLHDYKSGKTATAASDLVSKGVLQLLLYWHALESEGRVRPVAAIYRPMRGDRPRGLIDKQLAPNFPGEVRTDRVDHDRMREILDAALEAARGAVRGIRDGQVPTTPIGGSCPSWCGLEGICRVREASAATIEAGGAA